MRAEYRWFAEVRRRAKGSAGRPVRRMGAAAVRSGAISARGLEWETVSG